MFSHRHLDRGFFNGLRKSLLARAVVCVGPIASLSEAVGGGYAMHRITAFTSLL